MCRLLVAACCLAVLAISGRVPSVAAEQPGPSGDERAAVDFSREIFPLLRRACFECHGEQKQKAGLRLDLRDEAFGSGMIEPGHPDESELLRRIALSRGDDGVMPAIGDPLPPKQVDLIRRWIEQGANWPEELGNQSHWSYAAPVRPKLPAVSDSDWVKAPIDRFVLRRLDEEGLKPSPRATPEKLVRRLFLDLIGLPPSPEETDAFLADPSDERLVELVDDLLSRPQFGERWARPWLDLARYADSHGFQRDNFREIWPYRDWVIQALNDDMPFDQFTIEQIAGDLLPDATESQKIATGFHRCAPTNVEAGSLPEETRIEQVMDRVDTTGAVWLGTTLECCQCHDHKYDPFTTKEYYQLLAYYNSTEREADRTDPNQASSIKFQGPSMPLANPQRDARRAELQEKLDKVKSRQAERRKELSASLDGWSADLAERLQDTPRDDGASQTDSAERDVPQADTSESIPEEIVGLIGKPSEKWSKADRKRMLDYRVEQDEAAKTINRRVGRLEKQLEGAAPDTTLVMIELDEPRESAVFLRGDYRTPGEAVDPATPKVLHAADGPPNRLTLARWLVSRENPLVARVTVNRWWAELFGEGIVSTAEDFGIKGDPPSHPELLDWLAVEFMDNGWSMKQLLKTIVLSSTYQQSSNATEELLERDDRNRLLARGPRFRMDAEMIRDNALAISGLLSCKSFGPPIRPYQPDGIWSKVGGTAYKYEVSPGGEKHRRGIYIVLKRGSPYPSMVNFDATARLVCTVQRSRTNTPLQSLTLLNDPVYVEAAEALAKRVKTEKPNASLDDQLTYVFQLCTSRRPTGSEHSLLRNLYAEQVWADRDKADRDKADRDSDAELRAWYSVASVLLNLHETITKD